MLRLIWKIDTSVLMTSKQHMVSKPILVSIPKNALSSKTKYSCLTSKLPLKSVNVD